MGLLHCKSTLLIFEIKQKILYFCPINTYILILMKKLQCILYILMLGFTSLQATNDEEKDEILFISAYNTDSQYINEAISSFVDAYMQLHGKYTPVVEGLNCKTLNESNTWVAETKTLLEKHPNTQLVILMGPEAWVSYFSLTEEKYKKIPVFCIMSQRYCATLETKDIPSVYRKKESYIPKVDILDLIKDFNVQLCYYYEYGLDKDIQLIHSFFPKTKNIAVISDNTYGGLSHLRLVNSYLKEHHSELNIINIDGRSAKMEEALQTVRQLPPNTVGMLCVWRFDKDQVTYMNNAEYAFKKANPHLPVFSLTGTGIGYWAIGGNIPKYRSLGNELGEKAYELLDNKNWKGPFISVYENEYHLDMNLLKKWNLLNAQLQLPSDAVYVNSNLTWKEMMSIYKWHFILGITLFLTLVTSLIASLSYSIRIRRLKQNLEKSDKQLKHEKEELEKSEKQLRLAKEEAEEANRMKSTFVSNMSHEIRTPLNAIVGFSEILVSESEDKQELKEYASIIRHNSDILLKLVNDILDISRLEANKQSFVFENYDLIPYCSSIIGTLKNNVAEGVELLFNAPVKELFIITDIVRLQQIIINLIGNAIKFTEQGHIKLSLHPDNTAQMLTVWVTDTGKGIPKEEQTHVFERFRKLNEHVQGTGLGLAICQMTVKRLGGEIWIDSDYTSGTRFVFTLPMHHETGQKDE